VVAPFWLAVALALAAISLAFFHRAAWCCARRQPAADHAVHGDLGLAFLIEGVAQPPGALTVHALDLGIANEPIGSGWMEKTE